MYFLMRTYVYQQTIHQYYLSERKKESIIFATFNHIATILTRCQDQHELQKEQQITFNPIYISDTQHMVIDAYISHENNTYEIMLVNHISDGTDLKYMGSIILGTSEYTIEKFEKIYT